MIPKTILLCLCSQVFCYPQTVRLPNINNKIAAPAEVNNLGVHNHYPRYIAHTPDIYSQNNVEDTIKEVEAMLKANPTLPRLTRGEILDLLENITKTDMANNNVAGKDGAERDPKAIMVVMPYTPSNGNENNMEELFTKPPVTHIVGSEPFKTTQESFGFKRIPSEISDIPNLGRTKSKASLSEKTKTSRGNITRQRSSTSTPLPITTIKEVSDPPEVSTRRTSNRRRRPPIVTPTPTTYHPTRRTIRRRPTTTERYPNHRYPDEPTTESAKSVATALPSDGIKIIEAPKFSASDINEDLQMQENRQPTVKENKKTFVVGSLDKKVDNVHYQTHSNTASNLVDMVPDHLKGLLKDIHSPSDEVVRAEAMVSSSTTTIKTPSLQDEEEKIRNMLAAFGVLPVKTTTTTTVVPDVSNVVDSLTPEMKDLLMNFGLISDTKNVPVNAEITTEEIFSLNPTKAEVKPEAYVGFKPLPTDDTSRQDMEELLARFGLGRSSRKVKAMTKNEDEEKEGKKEELNFDVVPEQYLGVLEDIGLTDRQGKMIRSEALVKSQEKQHVFNPGDPQTASDEDLEKLNKLLSVIKQLESLNGSATDEDLKKIDLDSLKELISSLNEENKIKPLDEQNAPNPINFDVGLIKNEVKRQENSTSTTTEPSTTTTKEPQNGNIKDLEASFGGQSETTPATEATTVESTTQARKTGFYYLVDWNTFLDIDDQKGKRVNLRFQPKVGDPKRFYSVSVP